MTRFKCDKCGDVEPGDVMYSCPPMTECPGCGKLLEDLDGGIKIRGAILLCDNCVPNNAEVITLGWSGISNTCEECGCVVTKDNFNWVDRSGYAKLKKQGLGSTEQNENQS